MLGIIFFVFERPSSPKDVVSLLSDRRERAFRVEFEGQITGEYSFKKEIGLLVGKLIGEGYRLRKRDIYKAFGRKLPVEHFGIILKEGFFNVLSRCRKKG